MENSKRILVAEDEPGLRMVIESEIARAGFDVGSVTNGLDAIAKLSKEKFDLTILDVALPGKTGLEVLRFIREKHISTRVIMLTGMESISVAIKAVKLGADDYIPKPFDAEYLLTLVRTVLKLQQ